MELIKKIISFKYFKFILAGIGVILMTIFFTTTILSGRKERVCNRLRKDIIESVDEYVNNNNLLPLLNGTSVTVDIVNAKDKFTINKQTITGTVTYTKYNDTYIKTLEIANADHCTTNEFGKEQDKYDENENTKVNVYFNYNNVEKYNSKWTNFIESEKISKEATNGVYLPIDEEDLPLIPNNAIITEYVTENKTFYSYRDKKWKWYKNDIAYSEYSSEKPAGYTNKDEATVQTTEPTEWSLDYPEVHDYRTIQTKTGFQWYYKDGKERVYWENGKYSIESPGDEYKKDTETMAKMYSYTDKMWRWYNGNTRRIYSSLKSVRPDNYNYRDDTTLTYTKWTDFKDTSYLTSDNQSYREERTDLRTRYLIKYEIHYEELLENPVSLEELESIVGKSYEEILKDETLNVNVTFKFQKEA